MVSDHAVRAIALEAVSGQTANDHHATVSDRRRRLACQRLNACIETEMTRLRLLKNRIWTVYISTVSHCKSVCLSVCFIVITNFTIS